MLNFIYYPISGLIWVWHKVFGSVFGAGSGISWVLAIVFLVLTIRAILYWPTVKQIRTSRKMQDIQPLMKAIQKKYKNDRQRQAVEMRKLQKEHGFNPLLGCLPMLVQIPVFIGLFHVLRTFSRDGSNYFLGPSEVNSFLDARFLGAPIGVFIAEGADKYGSYGAADFTRMDVALVAVPLMIVASVATHMNARMSISRQTAAALENPQTAIMNKLMLWVFPLGILVTGAFWHVGLLIYMTTNNLWTYGQQHLVFRTIDREEDAKREAREEARANLAPKPGQRPQNPKRGGRSATAVAVGNAVEMDAGAEDSGTDTPGAEAPGTKETGGGNGGGSSSPLQATTKPGAAPRPGARPTGRRKKGGKGRRRR